MKDFIIIYGAGMVGELVYKILCSKRLSEKILCFAVTHTGKNQSYLGLPVREIKELTEYGKEAVVIVATLPSLHQEIQTTLSQYGFLNVFLVTKAIYKSMAEQYISEFTQNIQLFRKYYDVMLMSSDNSNSSGAFLCLAELAVILKKNKIYPLVILPEYGNGESELQKRNIEYLYIPSEHWCEKSGQSMETEIKKDNTKVVKRLEELIGQYDINIVHNNTSYTYVGAVAAQNKNIPVVWSLREFVAMQGFQFENADFSYHLINQSAKIIPVSNYIKNAYAKLDSQKTIIVYEGVDADRFYKQREIFQTPKNISIIVVGALMPLKGQEDVINALYLLYEKYHIPNNIQVHFVGNGEIQYVEYLKNLTDKYGLHKNISFFGYQANVEELYWESDIAVMSSRGDAFGRTTVEAQLSGCLVIGAQAGATPEIITSGETGVLYECSDSENLAQKLKYVIENIDMMKIIACKGQEYAMQNFTIEKNAESILKIYKEILFAHRKEQK